MPKPFIWGCFNGAQYWEFRTTREFVDFIKEHDCIVYAHNGGKFDWFFLLDELVPWQPLMVINGRLAKFKIGKAEFRDSFNIMPMPLAAVAKDEFDYTIMEPDVREKPENMALIREYLRNDCVYLHGMLMAFIEEFGLHMTQAGASVKAWERICDVKAPTTSREFYAELAPYYYGGRVQCFYSGEVNREFKIIDINSAYPYAMMHEHPCGDTITSRKALPHTDEEIAQCFITLTAESRGAFPLRAEDGSLVFPDDGIIQTFHVSGWEYLAARDTGALNNAVVHEVKTFGESIEFSAYLNHFYSMKTEAKQKGYKDGKWDLKWKARYEFSKRFLNSLYGKMGANPEHYEEFTVVKPQHIDAAEAEDDYQFVCELGSLALVSKPLAEEKQRYYNVAIAASITGFVRAYLWRAIASVRKAGGTVFYCDTDCLWATVTGDLWLHPEDLGAWDVEAECDYAGIGGKKLYAARTVKAGTGPDGRAWKTASKGVKLTIEQLVRVAKGEKVVYSPENPTFSLKRGVSFTPRTIRRSAISSTDIEELNHGEEARNPEE